jgi:hypothetical protein
VLPAQGEASGLGGEAGGGARISNLGIPTSTSTKKISCFLTAMNENTIKYGEVRSRSCFLLF